jgi:hypothetical protein
VIEGFSGAGQVPWLEKHRIGGREESRRLAIVEHGPWNQFKSWADSQSDLVPAMALKAGVAVELQFLAGLLLPAHEQTRGLLSEAEPDHAPPSR